MAHVNQPQMISHGPFGVGGIGGGDQVQCTHTIRGAKSELPETGWAMLGPNSIG